jgi:hypothetical protein
MSTAKISRWGWLASLMVAASVAHAQNGLRVGNDPASHDATWPRWQARFGLNASASPIDSGTRWQLSAGQLLGDFYWSGLRPAGLSRSGGFRATSGLLLGPRALALGTPALALPPGSGLTLSHNPWLLPGSGMALASESWSALPYVAVGYSGISLRGGWGFTADLGLVGTTGDLRAGRDSTLGSQGVDELLRELRLVPVLRVGAGYAF